MATSRSPRPNARYRKHRRDAAVRRRRIVLFLVLAASLVIAGVAVAWPKDPDTPVASELQALEEAGEVAGEVAGEGDAAVT
ncbi:MAG: hypothetical protein ACO3KD_03915, partial [Gaiellales bacterium]